MKACKSKERETSSRSDVAIFSGKCFMLHLLLDDTTGPDLPSDEEKATFLMYKENQDAIRFFLFARHLGDEKYTNLYNSAPKDKMKFKKACDELEKQGAKDALDVVETVKGHLDSGDPAWKEELEGLEGGEKQVLWGMFDKDTKDLMKNFKG